ncbi:type I restriction enzyme HsdR N-terminal domain-containing protein [Brucella rhizosphaerae]|uniref:type I restriction enzyme HsdR N-terminal domain-containing protein n=1 Tax=Brucella rhizosphaerae TaxID=571254 RepID=UPI00360EA990
MRFFGCIGLSYPTDFERVALGANSRSYVESHIHPHPLQLISYRASSSVEVPLLRHADDLWSNLADHGAPNEAMVETWFVLPLLEALGHNPLHVASKVPVQFQEGRKQRPGRKPEADFVVYAEKPFCRETSLIVVETKHPNEPLDGGKDQGESYANALRAPVLMLTNGKQLEVWQLQQAIESECVFSCDVAELRQHRAILENILSLRALRSSCSLLAHKRFDVLSSDLGDYERAAHQRVEHGAQQSIERQLLDHVTKQRLSSRELLGLVGKGAIVTTASGYGKTVLARKLLYEAIEQRWADPTKALPVDVFVPDLVQSGKSLEDFLTNRIQAYKPGFSNAALQDIARRDGLIVIADSFERVDRLGRSWLEAQLRTFLADYPKALVYVTSRSQVAPRQLELPVLALQHYSHGELSDLAALRSQTLDSVNQMFAGAPNHVYRLGEIPLIADLMLNYYSTARSHPTDLSILFEGWLEQILAASDPVDRSFDRQLLEDIAVVTVNGPINVVKAGELATNHIDPQGTLRRLAEQDAISLQGTTVELKHEALADHLRANRFWINPSVNPAQLDALLFDPSSLFGLLIVSNAPTVETRGAAWEAVARQNIQIAIRSLRFTGFDKVFSTVATEADARRLASDLQSTLETLINVHFKVVAPALRAELAGQMVERLGVITSVDEAFIHYQFFDANTVEEPISIVGIQELQRAPRMYCHALSKMGLGPGAGRVLAVKRMEEALKELIRERNLIGGRVWTEERTFGRLRHLARQYEAPIDPTQFDKALMFLQPHAGSLVDGNGPNKGQTFLVDELIADLRGLCEQGVNRLERWWHELDELNLGDVNDQQRFSRTLDAYYCRCEIAYDEVVTHSLPDIGPYLRTFRLMPLRMEIVAERQNREGCEGISLSRRQWPVRSFEEAGADVTFSDERPDHYSQEAVKWYVDRTDQLLHQFERHFDDRVISWGGHCVPDLKGYDTAFGKLPDESAIVSGAMEWLMKDLRDLFSEVPNGQWQNR